MNKDSPKYRYAGIDLKNQEHIDLLKNIQGNILKSHGRNYTSLIFITANIQQEKEVPKLRSFLKSLKITSALEQVKQAKQFKKTRKQMLFTSLLLSYQGYLKLGIETFLCPGDYAFRSGQKSRLNNLNENGNKSWQPFFKTDIDYLIIAAHNRKRELNSFLKQIRGKLDKLNTNYQIENGNSIGKKDSFGFRDGLSQPLFFKNDIEARININPKFWDCSFDPRHLVLVKDTLDPSGYGSYVVFRKIEQFINRYKTSVAKISKVLKTDKKEVNYALMGRFKDGKSKLEESKNNNFNFVKDSEGIQCPYASHIRKANPRSNEDDVLYKSMIRRGIVFDEEKKQGLHFMAYLQDISRQFEFVQKKWLNNRDYPKRDTGYDPIAHTTGRYNVIQIPINNTEHKKFEIDPLTQILGGEYFYAPSPQAIRMF